MMKRRLLSITLGLMLISSSFSNALQVRLHPDYDPNLFISTRTNSYMYSHYTIERTFGNEQLMTLHEDMPTEAQVTTVLKGLKYKDLSTQNKVYMLTDVFRERFEYSTDTEGRFTEISTLLNENKGVCRPLAVLFSSCLTEMGVRNKLYLTKNMQNDVLHVVVKVYMSDTVNLSFIADIGSNIQFKDQADDDYYGIVEGVLYLWRANQLVLEPGGLEDVLYAPHNITHEYFSK